MTPTAIALIGFGFFLLGFFGPHFCGRFRKPLYDVEFTRDGNNEYRWRARSPGNFKGVATAGEGFKEKRDCEASIRNIGYAFRWGRVRYKRLGDA